MSAEGKATPLYMLRRGMEVEVSLGAGPTWRRVLDVARVQGGTFLLTIEAAEAPEGRLAVTLREEIPVTARDLRVDTRNLRDVATARGIAIPQRA